VDSSRGYVAVRSDQPVAPDDNGSAICDGLAVVSRGGGGLDAEAARPGGRSAGGDRIGGFAGHSSYLFKIAQWFHRGSVNGGLKVKRGAGRNKSAAPQRDSHRITGFGRLRGLSLDWAFHGGPGVYRDMDQWLKIRQQVLVDGVSRREIISPDRHALADPAEDSHAQQPSATSEPSRFESLKSALF